MSKATAPHTRANDFDELLWQISGELAMTPASASLASAPFVDLEPEPEPPTAAEPLGAHHAGRRSDGARGWAAAGLAFVLAAGAFAFGTQASGEGPTATAMNFAHASAEHEFASYSEALLEEMRAPAPVVIPASALPVAAILAQPDVQVDTATPATVTKPRPRSKATPRKRPSPPKVSFDDL